MPLLIAVVFIVLTASWCVPCQRLKADYRNDARFTFTEVENTTVPVVIAMDGDKEIGRRTGYRGKADLDAWIRKVEGKP
jgi:thiol-disulfide isomerase/thioredoxin